MEIFFLFDATPIILTIVGLIILICAILLGGFETMTAALQENITGVLVTVFLIFLVLFIIAEIWSLFLQENEQTFKLEFILAIVHAVLDAGILFSYFYEIIFELSDAGSYESLWELFEFILGFIVVSLLSLIPAFAIFILFCVNSFVSGLLHSSVAKILFAIFIYAIKIALIWLIVWIYSGASANQEGLLYIKDNYPHYIYWFENWKATLR